jgi:hypothetical protein
MGSITVNMSIPYGATLRVGYRITNSGNAFTYVDPFPTYNDLPYTFSVADTAGTYDVQLTTICPNCALGTYSDPIVIIATPT